MTEAHKVAESLIEFIHKSSSTFHAVSTMAQRLKEAGFEELDLRDKWEIEKGGNYFVTRNGTAMFAFSVGQGDSSKDGFRIVAAHSDSPTFRIKPDPEILSDNYFVKLNTEVYGGPILMTWLDRPLSIAGRVSLRSTNPLWPDNRLLDFRRPVVIIPSLAIHFNRSVNDGVEFNRQKDMLPLIGIGGEGGLEKDMLKEMIASELDIDKSNILEYDLTLYEFNKGCTMGSKQEFISSPKLDNLAMAHAALEGLLSSKAGKATRMIAIFDNEEVGSLTKQGADSPLFRHIIERILNKLGLDNEGIQRSIYSSFMVSADMAHSVHPNYIEKQDPVLHPKLNKGPVIKITANQKYTSDSDSIAVFEQVCKQAGVPFQKFVNRSDIAGGSTLGNVSTGQIDIRCVDVGNPMLAMHSVRELAGTEDQVWMIKALKTFLEL